MRLKATRAAGVLAAAVLVLVGLTGCRRRPKAGDACRLPDQLACAAGDRALVCASGAWAEVPCRGARGCTRHSDADECDDTIAADHDPCPRNPPLDYACTADRSKALVCEDGRFTLWRDCRGPDGCRVADGRNVQCDTTLGMAGDPCAQQGTYACSVDRQTMLVCDGSTLSPATTCRGPGGCQIHRDTRRVDCDDTVAVEGELCDQPKRITCAADHKSELVCDDKKWAKKRECRRSDCRLQGNELFCD